MTQTKRIIVTLLVLMLGAISLPAFGQEPAKSAPWGEAVDGLTCRLLIQPRTVIGQAITAVVEVKNISDRKRWIVPRFDPEATEHLSIEITGPKGKVRQTRSAQGFSWLSEKRFEPINSGEVKRFEVADLRSYFNDLTDWQCFPERKAHPVQTGKYTVQLRFRSPKVPPRFTASLSFVQGKPVYTYKDVPKEIAEGQWANEIKSVPVAFELQPLGKEDLVVHEWGVFTVFNDLKYANANRHEEWGSLPSFFYRQFPKERLRWVPSAWDKPIVYFYSKATPMRVNVKVTFAEGIPVVWWPAAASPVDDWPGGNSAKLPRPFRTLTWEAWLGDQVPMGRGPGPLVKVEDFALPADCWLQQARLPNASRLTVIGNIEGPPKVRFPGSKDRPETERFLYYDGLVPAPDYLRCEQVDATSVTLRNRAKFDIKQLFIVDRRGKDMVRFTFLDQRKQPLKAGAAQKIELEPFDPEDWPLMGLKHVRQGLLDAGLFVPEADALLKIWQKRLLEAEGVTVFHILPASEYDRMLPLDILPAPKLKPVRVGITLHLHMELEPVLAERVGGLIRQLDSPQFEKRETAHKGLLAIGPLAITLLRAELKKDLTVEMRRRIEAVLERVDGITWLKLPDTAKKPAK